MVSCLEKRVIITHIPSRGGAATSSSSSSSSSSVCGGRTKFQFIVLLRFPPLVGRLRRGSRLTHHQIATINIYNTQCNISPPSPPRSYLRHPPLPPLLLSHLGRLPRPPLGRASLLLPGAAFVEASPLPGHRSQSPAEEVEKGVLHIHVNAKPFMGNKNHFNTYLRTTLIVCYVCTLVYTMNSRGESIRVIKFALPHHAANRGQDINCTSSSGGWILSLTTADPAASALGGRPASPGVGVEVPPAPPPPPPAPSSKASLLEFSSLLPSPSPPASAASSFLSSSSVFLPSSSFHLDGGENNDGCFFSHARYVHETGLLQAIIYIFFISRKNSGAFATLP